MADRTITAANSVYTLVIPGFVDSPQRLQGYSADAAFDTEEVEAAEIVLGVDGGMSIGWLPTLTMQTISLMPDSPSSDLFEDWDQASRARREVYTANGVITLPGSQKTYTMIRGVLSRTARIPGVRKTLQARGFRITWQSVTPSPYIPPTGV